jgi:hypothetical protein
MKNTDILTSYIKSFLLSTILFIYILKLPNLLTNQDALVNEYYYSEKTVVMLFLDLVLIAIYFFIAMTISNYFEIETFWMKVLVVSLTTFTISFLFYKYFLSRPMNDSFFSRWFYKAGENAVFYDVVFLTIVFVIFEKLIN